MRHEPIQHENEQPDQENRLGRLGHYLPRTVTECKLPLLGLRGFRKAAQWATRTVDRRAPRFAVCARSRGTRQRGLATALARELGASF